MTSFHVRLGLALFGLSVVALAERSAYACSGPQCAAPKLLPRDGATIPRNVPGFPYRPAFEDIDPWEAVDAGESGPVLKDDTGHVVPTTAQPLAPEASTTESFKLLLVPTEPLRAGVYTLETAFHCGEPKTDARRFTVAADAPAPAAVGTLHATAPVQGDVVVPGGAACVTKFHGVQTRIELAPAPDFQPFADSAVLEVRVDGELSWGTVGDWNGQGAVEHFDPFVVYANCETGYRVGRHSVEVRAVIPGAASRPAPATTEIELTCEGADGGADAGPAQEEPTTPVVADGGSCSAAPPTSTSGAVALLFELGLVVAFARSHVRRRR